MAGFNSFAKAQILEEDCKIKTVISILMSTLTLHKLQ